MAETSYSIKDLIVYNNKIRQIKSEQILHYNYTSLEGLASLLVF